MPNEHRLPPCLPGFRYRAHVHRHCMVYSGALSSAVASFRFRSGGKHQIRGGGNWEKDIERKFPKSRCAVRKRVLDFISLFHFFLSVCMCGGVNSILLHLSLADWNSDFFSFSASNPHPPSSSPIVKNGRWVGHSQLLRGVVVVVWGGGGGTGQGGCCQSSGWMGSIPSSPLSLSQPQSLACLWGTRSDSSIHSEPKNRYKCVHTPTIQ